MPDPLIVDLDLDLEDPRERSDRPLGPGLAQQVREAVSAVLGLSEIEPAHEADMDLRTAGGLIELAIEVLSDELRQTAAMSAARLAEMTQSLNVLVHAEREISAQALEERRRALEGVHAALAHLRGLTSLEDVLNQGIRRLAQQADFERAVLYRIADGFVIPHCAEPREGPEPAGLVGIDLPVAAAGVVAEAIRRRTPVLVPGAAHRSRHLECLPPPLAATGFLLAPVAPTGRVIGLIYADRAISGRPVDALDRDVLWAFAEGFGYAVERASLLERLHAQRRHFRELAATGESVMSELCEAPVRILGEPGDGASDRRSGPAFLDVENGRDALLSDREREVLEMIATGLNNPEIASRLCISENTVKSHVRRILRKLRAANRAEAVSLYLRLPGA